MQSALRKPCPAKGTTPRSAVVTNAVPSSDRRVFMTGLVAGGLVSLPLAAPAKDLKEAQAEKEARRKKLKDAMSEQGKTGKAQEVFAQPEYSVPEEARTSNWSGDRFADNQSQKQ